MDAILTLNIDNIPQADRIGPTNIPVSIIDNMMAGIKREIESGFDRLEGQVQEKLDLISHQAERLDLRVENNTANIASIGNDVNTNNA